MCTIFSSRTQSCQRTGTETCSNRFTKSQVKMHLANQHLCVQNLNMSRSHFSHVSMWVFIFVSVCFVFHSPYSETVEENPYRPTYIFPESNDRPLKTRGTLVIVVIRHLLTFLHATLFCLSFSNTFIPMYVLGNFICSTVHEKQNKKDIHCCSKVWSW